MRYKPRERAPQRAALAAEGEETLRRDAVMGSLCAVGPASGRFTDEQLAADWHAWAHAVGPWWSGEAWEDETHYAVHRFVRGLGVDESVAAADEAVDRLLGRRRRKPSPAALAWATRRERECVNRTNRNSPA